MDSTLYWLWLAEALGSGCRLAGRLLEEYPDPAELYGQVKAGWNPPEYLSAKAREFMQAVAPAQMAGLKKRCDDLNIFILTPDSADYPQRLRDLPDLPLVLYGTGNPACLNGRRYVGMVGTRRPTKYGLSACRDLSLTMAERGVVIVSGLAEGLDGAGHRAAVEAGQQTVAFLGTAINKTFPGWAWGLLPPGRRWGLSGYPSWSGAAWLQPGAELPLPPRGPMWRQQRGARHWYCFLPPAAGPR